MNNDNKLKEIDIKNCTCYCFDDIINIKNLNLDDILMNEYNVSSKTVYDAKPLCIIFNKVEWYIRKYDSTKYLAFFHFNERYKGIFDRIRYLNLLKSNISDVYFHKYRKIKIDSNDDLPL